MAEAVERHAREQLDQLAEQHEAEVAVDAARADLVLGPLAVDLLVDPLLGATAGEEVEPPLVLDAVDLAGEGPPAREAGAVREEVAEGDVRLPVHAEVVKEARDAIVDLDLPLLHEQHEGGGGGERLGERGEVEDGVRLHRRARGLEAPAAEGGVVEDVARPRDQDHGAGERARGRRLLDLPPDAREVHVRRPPPRAR